MHATENILSLQFASNRELETPNSQLETSNSRINRNFGRLSFAMKNILVIGAGRSASSLIKYLLDHSQQENWKVTVADVSLDLVKQKTGDHANARPIAFDINNEEQREAEIKRSDIAISMLPAFMHGQVAKDCVKFKKHLVTASYTSKEMRELDEEAKAAGIILMNEIGLDPGIDHASAMKIIDHIKASGGQLVSFRSYCGGLIAPESNDNPWGYKFTWNPRNVVLAGQGTAQYIEHGEYKYIPYNRLFTQIETIEVEGHGSFDGYANRDSLSYRQPYGLENIPTMLRGTLRMPGYCRAWNAFVKLGLTDDTFKVEPHITTYRQLLEAFLPIGHASTRIKMMEFLEERTDSDVMQKLDWLGIFEEEPIRMKDASPAQLLQDLLERRWKLQENDKDMIVMQHLFEYVSGPALKEAGGNAVQDVMELLKPEYGKRRITSSLVVKGEDQVYTAMAKTVGLPAAIVTKLILQGKIKLAGVQIPTVKEIYEPLLAELEAYGVRFEEKEQAV
jgi:saccharopine dehydrogenase (NADP+, L-glutamate forming)